MHGGRKLEPQLRAYNLIHTQGAERKSTLGMSVSGSFKAHPSDPLPPIRPYLLSFLKHFHQLEIKYSNI